MKKIFAGDTKQARWISSGQTVTSAYCAIFTGSETLVSSLALTDSGNGHFYRLFTAPSSYGLYVAEIGATVAGNTYIRRHAFKVIYLEVD